MTLWYLEPRPLAIIATLQAKPPRRIANTSANPLLTSAGYEGAGVAALTAIHDAEFKRVNAIRPWPRDAATSLIETGPAEILAALLGCPDGLEWAHPDKAATRAAIRANIAAALVPEAA